MIRLVDSQHSLNLVNVLQGRSQTLKNEGRQRGSEISMLAHSIKTPLQSMGWSWGASVYSGSDQMIVDMTSSTILNSRAINEKSNFNLKLH